MVLKITTFEQAKKPSCNQWYEKSDICRLMLENRRSFVGLLNKKVFMIHETPIECKTQITCEIILMKGS